eukprot:ANDGO_05049.mRNA.1 hypothetical protein
MLPSDSTSHAQTPYPGSASFGAAQPSSGPAPDSSSSSTGFLHRFSIDSTLKPFLDVPLRTVLFSLGASIVPRNSPVDRFVESRYVSVDPGSSLEIPVSEGPAKSLPKLRSDLYGPCVIAAALGLLVSLQSIATYLFVALFVDFCFVFFFPNAQGSSQTPGSENTGLVISSIAKSGYALASLVLALASGIGWIAIGGAFGLIDLAGFVSDNSAGSSPLLRMLWAFFRAFVHLIYVWIMLWMYL